MYRFIAVLCLSVLLPVVASAHQPYIVESDEASVASPEISKVYYGRIEGGEHVFRVTSEVPFRFYVNLLVPDLPDQTRDFGVVILKADSPIPLGSFESAGHEWTPFFEPFGYDSYLKGPEFEAPVGAGSYEIRVRSATADAKYALAIGKAEVFTARDTLHALLTIPQLKKDFFGGQPVEFMLSPLGAGYVAGMLLFSFLVVTLVRLLIGLFKGAEGRRKNIGFRGRLVRGVLGVLVIAGTVATNWNPLLLFFAGALLYGALFSWCGLCAVVGITCKPKIPEPDKPTMPPSVADSESA